MAAKFKSYELPVAYAMIANAKRIRPRRDGRHPFEQYFLYWAAFSNIYTTIAQRKGLTAKIITNDDGTMVTVQNGSVHIPQVEEVNEKEQISLTFEEFDASLKRTLVTHESTRYFVYRVPAWQGIKIDQDGVGQKVNGVINLSSTCDRNFPVWSPIDGPSYEGYLDKPENEEQRDFLARQIVEMLYTIRGNFMHSSQKFDDANDVGVVVHAFPLLELIVSFFIA